MTTPPPPTPLVKGPLVEQPAACARLAVALVWGAEKLYDAATLQDEAWMWEEARRVASHLLALCPVE